MPIPDFIVITILIFFALVVWYESRRGTFRMRDRNDKDDYKLNKLHDLHDLHGKEKNDQRSDAEALKLLREEVELLRELVRQGERHHHPHHDRHLKFIKILHGGNMLGPVTLTVGQSTVATVQGFDQNGAPFAIDFAANPISWGLDQPSLDSTAVSADTTQNQLTSLSAGVATVTATCAGFTDAETVTNVAVAPVLSSIKIDFSTPA